MTETEIRAACQAALRGALYGVGREMSDDMLATVAEVPYTEDVAAYVRTALALLAHARAIEKEFAMGPHRIIH